MTLEGGLITYDDKQNGARPQMTPKLTATWAQIEELSCFWDWACPLIPGTEYVFFEEAPAGAPLTKRSFWTLTQIRWLHLESISKNVCLFPKHIDSLLYCVSQYAKQNMSVWSTWALLEGWILKTWARQLNQWRSVFFENCDTRSPGAALPPHPPGSKKVSKTLTADVIFCLAVWLSGDP